MKIISKKNKPIKSYKTTEYNIIIIIFLYIISLVSIWLIIFKDFDTGLKIICVIFLIIFFAFFYWFFNFEFEIYNTYFTICSNLILLPFKIIFAKIYFDNIEWIDYGKIEGHISIYGEKFTVFEIKFYLKNGKFKKYSFMGEYNELSYIAKNWKTIAKYNMK
jgi:hypothetical protein